MASKSFKQKRAEFEELDERAWGMFFPKLQALTTYVEARLLVNNSPPPNNPGRSYYSNLGFFLMTFAAPDGASRVELEEYLRLIGCFDEEGALKEGLRSGLEEGLRTAIQTRSPFGRST